MTSSTTHDSPAQKPVAKKSDDGQQRTQQSNGDRAAAVPTELADLARAQEDLTQEVRLHVARQLVEDEPRTDDSARVGRMLTDARSELQQQLLHQEQERARRELADAARHGEDAVAGVVHSVTTIVRSLLPAALVRPEELIEATYSLADQGLRVGRRLALTVSGSARELVPLR